MPKTKQPPLTAAQLKDFRTATNRVSLESIKYAAEIVGYTDLVTATTAALETLVESGSAQCRQLYNQATKSTFRDEPLKDAITVALKWANSDGTGGFAIGNVVDAIYAARLQRKEKHSDEEVYRKLREIHDQYLGSYYQKLKTERKFQ